MKLIYPEGVPPMPGLCHSYSNPSPPPSSAELVATLSCLVYAIFLSTLMNISLALPPVECYLLSAASTPRSLS